MATEIKKETKELRKSVDAILADIDANKSKRFSNSEFLGLLCAVLADKDFKATRWIQKDGELIEIEYSINDDMRKLFGKVLKHAGLQDAGERDQIIDSFDFKPADIEFIMDAVEEAQWLYTEKGKSIWMFRNKLLRMSLSKLERTGKYEGQITYKKSVTNRKAALEKRAKAAK